MKKLIENIKQKFKQTFTEAPRMAKKKKASGKKAADVKFKPSAELGKVLGGATAKTREDVVAGINAYIKENKLESETKGLEGFVEPDETLAAVIGEKTLRITKIPGRLKKHLTQTK